MKSEVDVRARRIAAVLLLFHAAITLIVTLRHEPWRDEAQTWLVARDLPLEQTLQWTRLDGTPILWHALVLPFARGGAPYLAQSLLNWIIAVGAVALLLFRAPFGWLTKTLFVVSFYAAFEYAVIARSYALGILLSFAIVAIHAQRRARPLTYALLVLLLANVNAHCGAAAFAFASWFAFELFRERNRDARQWLAVIVMLAGIGLAFAQIYTPGPGLPPNVISPPYLGAIVEATSGAFFPGVESALVTFIAIIAMLVLLATLRGEALWLALVSLTGLAFLFIVVWIDGYRHYGLVLMTIIAALWLARPKRIAVIVLNIALAFSIAMTIRYAHADLTRNFSGSREIANVLRNETRPIAAHPPAQAAAVLPYLERRTLHYAALGRDGSYLAWDRAMRIAQATPVDRAAKRAAAQYADRAWLFLSATPLPHPESFGLRLRYATHEPLVEPRDARRVPNDERYWLYESTR
jgi:hypothetical protein